MAGELVHPHDNLFRKTFADPREAAGLLHPVLPAEFRDRIDWNTLAPVDASFVDDELRSAGEGEYAGTVGHYLLNTQDDKEIQLLQDHWQRLGGSPEGGIMSYAQQLIEQGRAQGEARGEAKGRVNTVESLLQVGVTWDVIEAATGLNEASFQDLKERLAATDDQ